MARIPKGLGPVVASAILSPTGVQVGYAAVKAAAMVRAASAARGAVPSADSTTGDGDEAWTGIGASLKELREQAGLSQAGLAAKAKMTAGMLSHIENGRRSLNPDKVPALEAALGLSEGALTRRILEQGQSQIAEVWASLNEATKATELATLDEASHAQAARTEPLDLLWMQLANASTRDDAGADDDRVRVLAKLVERARLLKTEDLMRVSGFVEALLPTP